MLSTITVRLKLSDFINTEQEANIIKMINKTHRDLRATILLHLWYENDEIKPKDVNNFITKYEDLLSFKTKIRTSSELESDEFIFFDVLPESMPKSEPYRFCYKYNDDTKIMNGLNELYSCVKFITSSKPNKRQKRNDYED